MNFEALPLSHDLWKKIAGTETLGEQELLEAKPSYERAKSEETGKTKTRASYDDMLTKPEQDRRQNRVETWPPVLVPPEVVES